MGQIARDISQALMICFMQTSIVTTVWSGGTRQPQSNALGNLQDEAMQLYLWLYNFAIDLTNEDAVVVLHPFQAPAPIQIVELPTFSEDVAYITDDSSEESHL